MPIEKTSNYSTRPPLPDLIRACALLGIALINAAAFAWPLQQGFSVAPMTGLDKALNFVITALFMTKAYALFSLMFGAGLAFQIASAKQQNKSPANRHFRRMFGLFILGYIHLVFFFLGDILTLYALMGCLLYAFRSAHPSTLFTAGVGLLALQVLIYLLSAQLLLQAESAPPSPNRATALESIQLNIDAATAVFSSANFMDAAHYRASQSTALVLGNAAGQGAGILGYFLLGLAIAKKGLINSPEAPFWHRCRQQAFPIGLTGSLFAAYICTKAPSLMSSSGFLGVSLLTLFAPFLALGYAGWLAKYASSPATKLKRFITRAGSATLSAYLLQSIVFACIFNNYGLGLYAKLGPALTFVIGILTGLITLALVSLWRKHKTRGPAETLLRRWTYLGPN